MSTSTKVDPSTLGWVKTEIDETLKQARLELEAFADNPADKTRLRFCITHLHQVVGTLLMVELDGAAMLARETEALAEAILQGKVSTDNSSLDVLTRAILTLPDYLARLQLGQSDVVIRQLPLINEMRAARQVDALPEAEVFEPDLSVRPPRVEGGLEKLSDDEYRALARRLRPAFHGALLRWLRESDDHDALREIGETFKQLQGYSGLPAAEQLFWVAGGLVEAMADGSLEGTADRKKFFARIDQFLRRLVDGDDRASLRKTAEPVIKGLLLEVGRAAPHPQGARVKQLKQAYELDSLLGIAATPDLEATELPTPEVLHVR